MCLITTSKFPSVVHKPITVYKLLNKLNGYKENIYFTPFRCCEVDVSKPQIPDGELKIIYSGSGNNYCVYGGAIHVYTDKDMCIYDKNKYNAIFGYNYVVYECVIPEGEWIIFGRDKSLAAASKIIFKEIVE